MKQLLILFITFLYAWAAPALDTEESSNKRFVRRGRGTRNICIDTGNQTGKQTLQVPKELVRFFTSNRRTNPAKRGKCRNKEGKKALKTLNKRQTKNRLFCRKIRGNLFTTRTIDAMSTWMIDNGFEEGKCTERSASTLKLKYIPPEPPKTKNKETETTSTPKPTNSTTTTETKENRTKEQDA